MGDGDVLLQAIGMPSVISRSGMPDVLVEITEPFRRSGSSFRIGPAWSVDLRPPLRKSNHSWRPGPGRYRLFQR